MNNVELNNKIIFITDVSGFIGANLAKCLLNIIKHKKIEI